MTSRRLVTRIRRRVFGHSPALLREYRRLFIVGSPRSGTTWVSQMLALHPSSISTRESHAYSLTEALCGHADWRDGEATRTACARVYKEQQESRVGIHNYVTSREFAVCLRRTFAWAHRQEECSNEQFAMRLIQEVFDLFFWKQGGTSDNLFVEKSPGHALYAEQILRYFPHCRVLHVVRDGRDVCVSMQMRSMRTDWSPADREKQVQCWLAHVSEARRAAEIPKFGDRVATVRYEDLHATPEQELRRIMQFAQLEVTSKSISRILEQTSFQKKHKTGPGRHSYKGVVGEWRQHFSEDDLKLYESIAGDLHRVCGYEMDLSQAAA